MRRRRRQEPLARQYRHCVCEHVGGMASILPWAMRGMRGVMRPRPTCAAHFDHRCPHSLLRQQTGGHRQSNVRRVRYDLEMVR